jgi:hypothetical protein
LVVTGDCLGFEGFVEEFLLFDLLFGVEFTNDIGVLGLGYAFGVGLGYVTLELGGDMHADYLVLD